MPPRRKKHWLLKRIVYSLIGVVAALYLLHCSLFVFDRSETLPARYERIEDGMTYNEIVSYLGKPDRVDTTHAGGQTTSDRMEWHEGPYWVHVVIDRLPRRRFDKVVSHDIHDDSTLSPLWRLRRWVEQRRSYSG